MYKIQNIDLDNNFSVYVTLLERSRRSATFILFTRNGLFFVRSCHYVMTYPQLAYGRVKFQIHRVDANMLTRL
jgi:hypothetical protein